MDTNDFLCCCLGIQGSVIDELCDEFDVDISDDDVYDALNVQGHIESSNAWNIGRELLTIVYRKIMDKYEELDRDEFDWDVSSPGDPDFYYKGEKIYNKEQLDDLVEMLEEV